MRIRVIKNIHKTQENQPDLRVFATDEEGNTEYEGGLWRGIDKNGNSIYTGELKIKIVDDIFEE